MEHKFLIRNGKIHTGEKFTDATDVLIEDGRVVGIGHLPNVDVDQVIDAHGGIVCPGFVDVQNMHDRILELDNNSGFNLVTQGVTSCIIGNCGRFGDRKSGDWFYTSRDWFSQQLALLRNLKLGLNVGVLLGHNTMRDYVLSRDGKNPSRIASESELKEMAAILEMSLINGALGMSTGLMYSPSTFANQDELSILAKVLGKHGRVYTTHMKDEGPKLVETISESLDITESGSATLVISHFKVTGKQYWGKSIDAINLIERRNSNQSVYIDFYPYTATSTTLDIILLDSIRKRYYELTKLEYTASDDDQIQLEGKQNLCLNGWSDVVIVTSQMPDIINHSIAELAGSESCYKKVVEILKEDPRTRVVFHNIANEDDYHNIVKLPYVMPGTDGYVWPENSQQATHPRNYGTFPHIIEQYVIAAGLVPLEEFIRQSTSVPAKAFNLKNRGQLKKGFFGDLIIFHPQNVKELATYKEPCLPSKGIDHVFVNGELVLMDGKPLGTFPGEVLS